MKKLILLSLSLSCALVTNPKPETPPVENVGALSQSETHVVCQPVHSTTDFVPPEVIDTDTDKPVVSNPDASVEEPEKVVKISHGF